MRGWRPRVASELAWEINALKLPIQLRMLLPIRLKFGIQMHPMKKLILISILSVATLAARAALPQPDLIAQIHFAGGSTISAAKNYSALANEFSSAEAKVLRAQTADKLAKFFHTWFTQNSGATVVGGATTLRPLLEELQNNEWYLESRNVSGTAETALAIKTSDTGAQAWQSGLRPYFHNANFERVNGWLIFRTSVNAPKISGNIPALNDAWLALDLNWPALGKFFPAVRELDLPETKFSVMTTATDFKIDGKFLFPANLTASLEPWRVPTNTLHQPFVSFTAVRGISKWLDSQPWMADYRLNPTPNQLFVWALPNLGFQTFAAIPRPDSADALRQASARLSAVLDQAKTSNELQFPLTLEQTNQQTTLIGLPFIAPYLQAINSSAGQFLLAGAFPNSPKSKPLPPDLFTRLGQKNIVFYHWEITAERVPTLLQLSQFTLMVSWHKQLEENSAALKWIQSIGGKLGNTVTEVFQTGADEMTFTRKAPGAFTAVELFALANWLEADNFPGCDLKMPPRTNKFKKKKSPVPALAPSAGQ